MHRQPEIRATRTVRDDVEIDASVVGDHLDLGAMGLGESRFVALQAAGLEVVVPGDDAIRKPQRSQRIGDRKVLGGSRVVRVVARQEDEVRRGADVPIDLGDGPLQAAEAEPAVAFIHMQVADVDPGDRRRHAGSPGGWLPEPAQAGRSVPAKPTQSPTLTSAKLPRMKNAAW